MLMTDGHIIDYCHLIVIHDSVERLYPHRVNISIQYYPLGVVPSHVGKVSHDA